MTKRRSVQLKVSKPATPALEKAITECVSEMKRRYAIVNVVRVQMVVKKLVSEGCEEKEVTDGIKDMVNLGKLRLGSATPRLGKNSAWTKTGHGKKLKKFGERTVNLSTADKENQSAETESKYEKTE